MKETILFAFESEPNIICVVRKSFWEENHCFEDSISEDLHEMLMKNNFYAIDECAYEYEQLEDKNEMTLSEYFSKSDEEQAEIKKKFLLSKPLSFEEAIEKLKASEFKFEYSQEATDFLKECAIF